MNTGTVLPYWVHDEQLLDAFIKGCKKKKSLETLAGWMEMSEFSLSGSIKYIRIDYDAENYTPEQHKIAEKILQLWDEAQYSEQKAELEAISKKLDQALTKQK